MARSMPKMSPGAVDSGQINNYGVLINDSSADAAGSQNESVETMVYKFNLLLSRIAENIRSIFQ